MAKYGARKSRWAPWKDPALDTDPDKLPQYGDVKSFGELNKVSDSPNFIEGSLPGDDQIILYEQKFKDGTVTPESVFIPIEDAAAMLGASFDDKMGMSRGEDDEPPFVGYGFLTHHLGKSKSYYQVVFYPKLKASPSAEDYETRGDNISFRTDKLQFKWLSPACRKYQVIKDFPTEAEADAYLDGLFAGTAAVPGLPAPTQPATTQPAQTDS